MARPLPYTVPELIEQLDEEIPHRCTNPSTNEREALFYGGKRALIDELKLRLEATEKRGLKDALLKE